MWKRKRRRDRRKEEEADERERMQFDPANRGKSNLSPTVQYGRVWRHLRIFRRDSDVRTDNLASRRTKINNTGPCLAIKPFAIVILRPSALRAPRSGQGWGTERNRFRSGHFVLVWTGIHPICHPGEISISKIDEDRNCSSKRSAKILENSSKYYSLYND